MGTWEIFANFFGSYYTWFIALVAHSNIFLTCLSYSWPSPVLPKLFEAEDNPLGKPLTPDEGDFIAAIFYVGAAVGPILFFGIVEKIGRRKVLMAISIIPPICYGVLMFADTVTLYNICRVLLGLWTGIMFSIEPVYVSEVLADEERSFLMSIITIFGFSGVFAAVSVGPFVSIPMFNGLIALVSLVISILMIFGFPESPFFLMKTKGEEATQELLRKLRNRDIVDETVSISKTVANETKSSFLEIFSNLKNLKFFMLATLPLLLQSYSGIALILNYSQLIFMETNVAISSEWCSIIVIGFTLSTTFLTPLFMDKKVSIYTLLILCLTGIATCDFLLGMYFLFGRGESSLTWVPLVVLVIFVLVYNCGLDPIPWMLLGESYPLNISAMGTALSTSIFEISVFPSLYFFHKFDLGYLFLFSCGFSLFGVFYIKFFVVPDVEKSKKTNQIEMTA
ncbi:facilitated trehalose transporter Tret1-like [Coccinella septempunctata]|uniref:facilitated trehalose transporter Tret1-like n=1 Tax=Coccinella septempunctata TaxID=41139 RepID=UPI001D05DB57|nr:facilitated trehalose transporter Tret1-like [Coccinella septempunctata]